MRIQMVITRGIAGGAPIHVLLLLEALRDHATTELIVGEEGFLAERVRALGIPVHVVEELSSEISLKQDVIAYRQISSLMKDFRPELVHAHSSKAGVLGRLAAHRLGIPAVFTAHGWGFDDAMKNPNRFIARVLERRATGWSEQIITVSERGRQQAIDANVAPTRKLVTIHNGIPDVPTSAPQRSNETPVVSMVARFAAPKDYLTLVRAVGHAQSEWELWLIGDGPAKDKVEAEVEALGLGDRISFLGTRTDVPDLLAASDILALASKSEGFPLTVLEGMRAGLPVVASDVGGISEAVGEGQTGFLVPVSDAAAFADRIDRLVGDHELRLRFGHTGRQRFEEQFMLDHMVDRTREVYDQVLARRS